MQGVQTAVETTHGWLRHLAIRGHARDERFDVPALDGDLKVFLELVQFDSVDFSGLDFREFSGAGSTFVRCDFSDSKFRRLHFGEPQVVVDHGPPIRWGERYPQTIYEECLFRKTRFDPWNTHFGNTRFVRCLFDRAWLRKLLFTRSAEFVDCRFVGKIIECNFFGAIPDPQTAERVGRTTNEFHGNDFREADLIWVGFRGIDLDDQRWPDSDDYAILTNPQGRVETAMARAHAELSDEELDRALHELEVKAGLFGGERQVLVRRSELGSRAPQELRQRLWDYLTK